MQRVCEILCNMKVVVSRPIHHCKYFGAIQIAPKYLPFQEISNISMDLAGLTLSLVTLVSPKQIAKTFQQKPTWVLYICIGVWLLAHLTCDLSQAQNKILLKAEEMHKMAYISLKICSTSVTFLSLRNLKAAPEEAMQLLTQEADQELK